MQQLWNTKSSTKSNGPLGCLKRSLTHAGAVCGVGGDITTQDGLSVNVFYTCMQDVEFLFTRMIARMSYNLATGRRSDMKSLAEMQPAKATRSLAAKLDAKHGGILEVAMAGGVLTASDSYNQWHLDTPLCSACLQIGLSCVDNMPHRHFECILHVSDRAPFASIADQCMSLPTALREWGIVVESQQVAQKHRLCNSLLESEQIAVRNSYTRLQTDGSCWHTNSDN